MPSTRPFFESDGSLAVNRILSEAIPVAKLVSFFVAIALAPLVGVLFVGGTGGPGILFAIIAQFVLAVGGAVTLLYVVVRGITLADEFEEESREADSDDAATSRR